MELLTAKRLREDRASLVPQIKGLNDTVQSEKRDFNAEEKEKWDSLNRAYDEFSVQIERAERTEKVIADQEEPNEPESRDQRRSPVPGRSDVDHNPANQEPESRRTDRQQDPTVPTEEDRCLALQAWLRAGENYDLSEQHKRAAAKCGVRPYAREISLKLRNDYRGVRQEARALSAASGTAGSYTIPEGFVSSLETAMLFFGGMRQSSEVMRTSTGNPMPWPTANDSGNSGVRLGENTSVATNVDPTFGQVVFYAYKYSSRTVLVPSELLDDSAFNLGTVVGGMLGERLGRIQNTEFTLGTGANMPYGIVPRSTLGKTTAGASAITFDEILDLIHSVDIAYRNGAGFMFHDGILQAVRKLKDGQNNYLWQPSTQVGAPDRIWGYPYYINNDMQSSVATGTKTMLFGQLSKYKIRDVGEIRMLRLNERYADTDQVGFTAFIRGDGNLLDAGVAPVKHMLQA